MKPETNERPSLGWALAFYGGAALAGYRLLPEFGWLVGMAGVFLTRGAMDIPLFRDEYAHTIDGTPARNREKRLNSFDAKAVNFVFEMVGKVLGIIILAGFALGILIQLPQACSGPSGGEIEYRAP